jgi:hypothetical protein
MARWVRFDKDGLEFRVGGIWRESMLLTIIVFTAIILAAVCLIVAGPLWISIPLIVIVAVPHLLLIGALFWTGGQELIRWILLRLLRRRP